MMTLEQAVLEGLRSLPNDKQQEVLDFVEFLRQKPIQDPPEPQQQTVWESAGDLIGSLEGGPEDLSSNPTYLE